MPQTARAFQLVGELADAIGAVHTVPTLGRTCAEVLRAHLPLRWFELGRFSDAAGAFDVTRCDGEGPAGELHVQPLQRTAAQSLLPGNHGDLPLLWRPRAGWHGRKEGRGPRPAPSGLAGEAGLGALWVLPLLEEGQPPGYAAVALSPAAAVATATDAALGAELAQWTLLLRVLRVAWRGIHVLERVADLSRRAHAEKQQLRSELRRMSEPERVVALSAQSRRVLAMADLVAPQGTTVLLLGESGTGKEVLARRIHRLSPRTSRPFVKVNCAALPEGLVESTLFGHERGAFTGASARHRGVFERAHGGTLLLDEIAELPMSAQAKLLRVLQDGEVERVGGEATYRVDVRLITATHRSLEQMVERGSFRGDLYFRLNVFPIQLVPLRERFEDLPVLAQTLLEKIAHRHGRAAPPVTPQILTALRGHLWPGNIRELENLLERALVLTPEQRPLVLPPDFARSIPAGPPRPEAEAAPANLRYDEAVRRCIEEALSACAGQLYGPAGAAARLGLRPTTLQSKMRKLKIPRTRFLPNPPT